MVGTGSRGVVKREPGTHYPIESPSAKKNEISQKGASKSLSQNHISESENVSAEFRRTQSGLILEYIPKNFIRSSL